MVYILPFVIGLSYVFHLKFIFLITLLCFGLLLLEQFHGKINIWLFTLIAMLSPVMDYLVSAVSYPIRMAFMPYLESVFRYLDPEVSTSGLSLFYKGQEFSVDPACAGLYMLSIVLVITTGALGIKNVSLQSPLEIAKVIFTYLAAISLTIACNFIRIVLMVVLNLPAGSVSHEFWGLLSFVLIGLLPTLILLFGIFRKPKTEAPLLATPFKIKTWSILFLLPILLCGLQLDLEEKTFDERMKLVQIKTYEKKSLDDGITQFSNGKSLIYFKSIKSFYGLEHNPAVCWGGSGYSLQAKRNIPIAKNAYIRAELAAEDESLQTLWFYYNGKTVDITNIAWRKDVLTGSKPYFLVNITAQTEEELNAALAEVLRIEIR